MELAPYIFFHGRCEEALEFYKAALGGTYEAMRMADSPMGKDLPPAAQQKIMHATFKGAGMTFMASDGQEEKTFDPALGNISLSVTTADAAEGERLFTALASGGTVDMPLSDAFWGGRFGMVTDKFGTEWMMSIS